MLVLRRNRVLNLAADLLAGSAGTFADALAQTSDTFAKFFAALNGLAMRDVLAKSLTATAGALAPLFVGVPDAFVFSHVAALAMPAMRHVQLAFGLVLVSVLILLILNCKRTGKRCRHKENGNEHY